MNVFLVTASLLCQSYAKSYHALQRENSELSRRTWPHLDPERERRDYPSQHSKKSHPVTILSATIILLPCYRNAHITSADSSRFLLANSTRCFRQSQINNILKQWDGSKYRT